jgi:hypothetical protein
MKPGGRSTQRVKKPAPWQDAGQDANGEETSRLRGGDTHSAKVPHAAGEYLAGRPPEPPRGPPGKD